MDEEDLMDADLQDQEEGADTTDATDVPAQALPPSPAVAQRPPVTGMDSMEPGWWIPKPAPPSIDRGRVNAIRDLYNAVPISDANKAIEMATRLEGVLGFDAEVKSGVSTLEALKKWAPKMYFNNPGAVSKLMQPDFKPGITNVEDQRLIQTSPNRYQLIPKPDGTNSGDIQAIPITTPEGKQLGYGVRSKSGVHTRWDTTGNNAPKPSVMIQGYNAQLRSIDKAIEQASFAGDKEREARLTKDADNIRQALSTLTSGMTSGMAAPQGEAGLPVVTTKEQYDQLPRGATYLNGKSKKPHRKP